MSYKYMLRFAVEPGFQEEVKLADMLEFCKQAQIDDVMFFINCEELNQGHLTAEETAPWLELIGRAKQMLGPLNITTSINPWITLLHTDRGRTLKPGQDFTTMVDPHGMQASAVACPLCRNWRDYLTDMYSRYASLEPHVLWVEDDFRLHNHHPLHWGGCFCPLHMAEFSRRAGHAVSREDFVRGMLAQGQPHEYRKIWLDTARETMAELAEQIGTAVHKVSPSTRVGLMSSAPTAHCTEGRDWHRLLTGLSGPDTPRVDRPHLPAYQSVTGQQYLWNFMATSDMVRALVPDDTEIYPEMEDFPDTRFSKSHAFHELQLKSSMLIGSKGITLNIFDMMGNGVLFQDKTQDFLSQTKPFLNRLEQLNLKYATRTGINVLYSPLSSYTVHTSEGREIGEIAPDESFWACMLSCFGIANRYNCDVDLEGKVVAVSGQYFRNLSADTIKQLFARNYVILEADAAWTLCELGLGELAGIRSAQWRAVNTGFCSYEQVCNGKTYYGITEARMSAQTCSGDLLDIEYIDKPELICQVKSPAGQTVANGLAVYAGRVFIYPYRQTGTSNAHLHPVMQQILQESLQIADYEAPAFVETYPYVNIQSHIVDDKPLYLVSNFSEDDLDNVVCRLPERTVELDQLKRYDTAVIQD